MVDRMCMVTRAVQDEAELIRFVRRSDGLVFPDLKRKLPGRGVWVGVNAGLVAEAMKRNLFVKGFGAETKAPEDLVVMIENLLRKEALAGFSLARKAGIAVTGFSKVEAAIGRGVVKLLVHATEAASDGCEKLDRMAVSGPKTTNIFSCDELSLAFGQANVIHAAVNRGGMADKLLEQVRRVERYSALRTS